MPFPSDSQKSRIPVALWAMVAALAAWGWLEASSLRSSSVTAGGKGGDGGLLSSRVSSAPATRLDVPKRPAAENAPEADPAFRWGDVYVFPNPARGGRPPVVHVEAGLADSVSLTFYDVAGDLAHRAVLESAPLVVDDGQGPQYAYEYVWSGRIASGVYFCRVEAKRGPDALVKIIKLAVLR